MNSGIDAYHTYLKGDIMDVALLPTPPTVGDSAAPQPLKKKLTEDEKAILIATAASLNE
jgi:hypothetical protein